MNPTRRFALATLGALALGLPATGQNQTHTIPASYESAEAPGAVFWAMSPFAARRQLLLGASHLNGLQQEDLLGLEVRRNAGTTKSLAAGVVRVQVTLSHAANEADRPSSVFADNRGPDATVVFDGVLTLPNSPPPPVAPSSWSPPNCVLIPFQQSFPYQGGTLCIETVTTPVAQQGRPSAWWPLDGVVVATQTSSSKIGSSCLPGVRTGVDRSSLVPGGTASFHASGALEATSLGFCVLGTNSTTMGTLPLPFDLTSLGAPGCEINVELLLPRPTIAVAWPRSEGAIATVSVEIPLDANLSDQDIYAQWLWPTPTSNALGLSFTDGIRARIASPSALLDASWIEAVDTSAAAGDILKGRLPVLRIHH